MPGLSAPKTAVSGRTNKFSPTHTHIHVHAKICGDSKTSTRIDIFQVFEFIETRNTGNIKSESFFNG